MRYFKIKVISEKYDKVNKKFCEQFSTPLKKQHNFSYCYLLHYLNVTYIFSKAAKTWLLFNF